MRKTAAFMTALALLLLTAAAAHSFAIHSTNFKNAKFGTWVCEDKFLSAGVMSRNLNENSLVVFGSSEFNHGRSTPYHPANLLSGQPFQLMLVGAGYYQSLFHATALGAMDTGLENRRAVLLVSPQWFRRSGVKPQAYASRFSETNFINMLRCEKLSQETRQFIVGRTEQLLADQPKMLERVRLFARVLLTKDATPWERAKMGWYESYLTEKQNLSLSVKAMLDGVRTGEEARLEKSEPNWQACAVQAVQDGGDASSSNSFGMNDSYYRRHVEPKLKEEKDSALEGSYTQSPEFDDLRCFLQVCREMGVRPMLVSLPVNGLWYDYTGFPKENRLEYYQMIRDIAEEYGAELVDFSGDEYTPQFFEDNVHIGWKGWVSVNESIYRFAQAA